MTSGILDGKKLAKKIMEELRFEVTELKKDAIVPGLAVVLVGNDSASKTYVASKKRACEKIGIESYEYILDEDIKEAKLIELIKNLNGDSKINGILVQLPLPESIDEMRIIEEINPLKDVDGFHPVNLGKLILGKADFVPCTPAGIMELINLSEINVKGKECVVVGRSNIVGKPQSILLLNQNATVTICHSKTKNLKEVCRRADVLVVAIGNPGFITNEYVKPGCIVIDVGINRLEDKSLVGDVDFSSVSKVASYITPVPGGVGPMTIAMLMKNTIIACKRQSKRTSS